MPPLRISSIIGAPTSRSFPLSSSESKEIGEGSFDSLEEPTSFVGPVSTLGSTSAKLSSQELSEKDRYALRLMRNRLSAERSRNRKRQRMEALEQEVRKRDELVGILKEDLNALLRYVERLEAFCKVLDVPSSELRRPELHYKP